MNNGVPDNTEVMKLSYNELNDRAYEMGQCAAIDQGQADSYNGVMADYVSAKNDRYKFYVERHKLKQAMLREDAAGKRTQ